MNLFRTIGSLRLVAVAVLLGSLGAVSAPASFEKTPDRQKLPFDQSEELVYDGEFSRAIFRGINIAELRFTADRVASASLDSKESSPLRFTIEAKTKGILRKLFGLDFRQRVESTVDPVSFSVLQTTKLDEQGKRKRTSEAVFDRNAGTVVWTERDPNDPTRQPRVVTSQMSGTIQDIASAFYFLRTQPLQLGQKFDLFISDSGYLYRVPVAVTERKRLNTVIGRVQTLKVEPQIFGDGLMLRGKGKIAIWFTDDARHIPVRAKINNEMGTLDIKLKKMTNHAAR